MFDTSFAGAQILRLDSVDSTNNYAAKLIKEVKVFDGTVIMAREQASGKGQRGNHWYAQPGKNLTFSLIVFPKIVTPANQFILSQITALAISDLLMVYGIENAVKWPNDIITQKGKICGILIENSITDQQLNHSIIGVGLNVNQTSFSEGLNATSMIHFLQDETELENLLHLFCKMFDKWYLMLNANRHEYIHNSYLLRLLNFGKLCTYIYKQNRIEARIINVENNGLLILEKTTGEQIKADLKEISFVF